MSLQIFAGDVCFGRMRMNMPEYVKIIGRAVGDVTIKDIDKKICYSKIISISIEEANQSNDLINAFNLGWIDIIYGKKFLTKLSKSNDSVRYIDEKLSIKEKVQSIEENNKMSIEQLISIKKYVDNAIKESTDTIISQLQKMQMSNIDVESISNQIASKLNITKSKNDITDNSGVFIDLDENSKNIENGANLNNVKVSKGEKVDVSSSLERIKRFKK